MTRTEPHDEDAPPQKVMFRGIRYGRPGGSRFDGRLFLLMILIAAVLTFLIDLVMPAPEPPPPVERTIEVQIGPRRPPPSPEPPPP